MATVQRFEGPSLDDVLAQVRLALGDDAEIIEANRIKASGVFGQDRFEVKARRAQKGQRRADRQAANAHVNPRPAMARRGGRDEGYPGGLDDATVQAAMDHVQQVMADLERKRIVQDHADAPSPTRIVDLADQVVDDSPELEAGYAPSGDDAGFAALLAEARANAKANAPKIPLEWPELDASTAPGQAGDGDADGTVEWEPLDWTARRVRSVDPEPMDPPVDVVEDEGEVAAEVDDDTDRFESSVEVDEAAGVDEAVEVEEPAYHFESAVTEDSDEIEAEAELVEPTEADDLDDTEIDAEVDEPTEFEVPEASSEDEAELLEPIDVKEPDTVEDETDGVNGRDGIDEPDAIDGEVVAASPDDLQRPWNSNPIDTQAAPEDIQRPWNFNPSEDARTEAVAVVNEPQEAAPTPQTSWVDADREFMGVWTDEADDDAGWFATGEPDDEIQAFTTLRNHRLVEWLSRNDLTPEALAQALEGLPRPDDLPPGPGVIIAVVGEGPLVLPLARRIAVDLDADPAMVVLASEHRSHASVPDNCRISSADEAALDRRAWRRRGSATLVAVDTSTSLAAHAQDWAYHILEALQPHQVIALVDAGRKAEDVARWIADLGGIDAIALTGLEETVSPHAILELGIPVARLGTQVATPGAWSALLRNRREPAE